MFRRDFLVGSSVAVGLAAAGVGSAAPLNEAKSILSYGAKPDGKAMCTRAIQRAIDDVFKAGGGLVYVPPGRFLMGGLELKSRVTLYLEAGAVLLGSTRLSDYEYRPGLPRSHSDVVGYHVIFARGAEDITLCGLGTIDGQGAAWWEIDPNYIVTPENAWQEIASSHYRGKYNDTRPSPMVELVECRNVRISGITLKDSAGWTMRPIGCETVMIDGVRIRNPYHGKNTDGMDITASSNVFVSNCDIETGDDGICLKSENPYGAEVPATVPATVPVTRNITVTNCTITTSCNGFKLGTATRGAFENIVFSNSSIYSPDTPIMDHESGGLSIETVDGGSVDGVVISNIRMQNVRGPIFVRLGQRHRQEGSFLRNVLIEGVDAEGATVASSITGVPGLRPSDITVSNCRLRTVAGGEAAWAGRQIPEVVGAYPECWMMGRLPAYGFYVRHADRVRLHNVEYVTDQPDGRPAIVCDDVEDAIFRGLELSKPSGDAPLLDLRDTRRVFVNGMRSPVGNKVFAAVSGAGSSGIRLLGNLLNEGEQAVSTTGGAAEDAAKVV